MNIDKCKEQIKRHEGEVLEIYLDSLGYKTLGIGHLCQPQDPEYNWEVGTAVTQEVVDMYFDSDFSKHVVEAIEVVGKDEFSNLPDAVKEVIVATKSLSFFESSSNNLLSRSSTPNCSLPVDFGGGN